MPQKLKNTLAYEALLLPALVIFVLFVLYPAMGTVYNSLTNWTDINLNNVKFVGFRHYQKLFTDKSVLIGIRNSFAFAVSATVLQSAAGLLLALPLNRAFKTKNLLRAIWYVPAVLSTLIIGFLWNYMLSTSDMGLLNRLIAGLGFAKVNFLGNAGNALACIIFVSVWQWAGWTMTIYLANLQGIPEELYESAAIDGAAGAKRFFSITLPMLFPSISFSAITGMINGLKVFDLVKALTNGGPNGQTDTIITLMMRKGFTEGFYSYACAMGVVFLAIVLIITGFQMKYFNRWGENVS
jgi:raffinose/stachyose/melibiose transport system permease protein